MPPMEDCGRTPPPQSPGSVEWNLLLGTRGPQDEDDVKLISEFNVCQEKFDTLLAVHGFDVCRQVWLAAEQEHSGVYRPLLTLPQAPSNDWSVWKRSYADDEAEDALKKQKSAAE